MALDPDDRARLLTRLHAITEEALALENARLMFVAGAIYAMQKAIEVVTHLEEQ